MCAAAIHDAVCPLPPPHWGWLFPSVIIIHVRSSPNHITMPKHECQLLHMHKGHATHNNNYMTPLDMLMTHVISIGQAGKGGGAVSGHRPGKESSQTTRCARTSQDACKSEGAVTCYIFHKRKMLEKVHIEPGRRAV